jgi:hypothetical protein
LHGKYQFRDRTRLSARTQQIFIELDPVCSRQLEEIWPELSDTGRHFFKRLVHVSPKLSSGPRPQFGDELLAQTLSSVASILLRLGFNAPQVEKLLRRAFVNAATINARATGWRATQSQIASLAGVSRLEVRRILAEKSSGSLPSVRHLSRLEQVLTAWRTDPAFLNKRGSPRPLRFTGPTSPFSKLVRKYGRDVTIKTLRDQLVSANAATERQGYMVISPNRERHSKQALAASADLRFLEAQLKEMDLRMGKRAYVTRRTSVWVADKKSARRPQREALEKVGLMLAAINSISSRSSSGASSSNRSNHRILITATIATESREKRDVWSPPSRKTSED